MSEQRAAINEAIKDVQAAMRAIVDDYPNADDPERDALMRRYYLLAADLEALIERRHALALAA